MATKSNLVWKSAGWEVRDPGLELVKNVLPTEEEAIEWLRANCDPRRHIVLERHELVREA